MFLQVEEYWFSLRSDFMECGFKNIELRSKIHFEIRGEGLVR